MGEGHGRSHRLTSRALEGHLLRAKAGAEGLRHAGSLHAARVGHADTCRAGQIVVVAAALFLLALVLVLLLLLSFCFGLSLSLALKAFLFLVFVIVFQLGVHLSLGLSQFHQALSPF